jgi:hypothetical protein
MNNNDPKSTTKRTWISGISRMDKLKFYQDELRNGWIHNSMRAEWVWCPRSFKLRYIDGEVKPPSEVMEMGTGFHEFARIYHKTFKIYDMEEFNLLNELMEWQLSFIPENTMPVMKIYLERFITFECKRYWYYARALTTADEEYLPRYTELHLRHRYGSEAYGRAGTIDAVFKITRGGNPIVRLREYKVSRKTTGNSDFIGKVRGQLTFYKDLIDRVELYGNDMSFRFELYNPIMDNGIFPLETGTFERTRNGIHTPYWFLERPISASKTALDRSMLGFVEALESDYYPRQPKKNIDYKCVYCAFYSICWGRY